VVSEKEIKNRQHHNCYFIFTYLSYKLSTTPSNERGIPGFVPIGPVFQRGGYKRDNNLVITFGSLVSFVYI
jgi:hypothetical protein